MKAARLISSDRPAAAAGHEAERDQQHTGQRIRPPAFCDISPLVQAFSNSGQEMTISM
jgi:hypothetical protein